MGNLKERESRRKASVVGSIEDLLPARPRKHLHFHRSQVNDRRHNVQPVIDFLYALVDRRAFFLQNVYNPEGAGCDCDALRCAGIGR